MLGGVHFGGLAQGSCPLKSPHGVDFRKSHRIGLARGDHLGCCHGLASDPIADFQVLRVSAFLGSGRKTDSLVSIASLGPATSSSNLLEKCW